MPEVMKAKWSQASGLYGSIKRPSEIPSVMRKDPVRGGSRVVLFKAA
jgi:hypothetical protein